MSSETLSDREQERFIKFLRAVITAAENSNQAGEIILARIHNAYQRDAEMRARRGVTAPASEDGGPAEGSMPAVLA